MKQEPRRQKEMNRGGEHIMQKKKANGKPIVVQSEKTSTDQLDKNAASTSATVPAYKKKASLRKAVYRAAKLMPQERRKYADVITRMVEKSIPKTKKVLQERVTVSPSSKKKLDFMSTSFANLKKNTKKTWTAWKRREAGSENKEDAGVFSWPKIKSKYLVQHGTKLGIL